jgi:hypothetical protein
MYAFEVYDRIWCRQYQHRRQIRAQFATDHAKDCAESWNGLETALHRSEEAHRHFLDQLGAEDTEAVINRTSPTTRPRLRCTILCSTQVRSAQLKPTLHRHLGFLHNGNYNLTLAAAGNGNIDRRSISVNRPAQPASLEAYSVRVLMPRFLHPAPCRDVILASDCCEENHNRLAKAKLLIVRSLGRDR